MSRSLGWQRGLFGWQTSIVFGLVLFAAESSGLHGATLRPETKQAAREQPVTIMIDATNVAGLGALEFELLFDSDVVEFLKVRSVGAGANALVAANELAPGRIKVGLATLEEVAENGPLLALDFNVTGDVGEASALRIEEARAWEAESQVEMLVGVEPGRIEVMPAAWGDPQRLLIAGAVVLLAVIVLWRATRRRKTASSAVNGPLSSGTTARRFCTQCGAALSSPGGRCSACETESEPAEATQPQVECSACGAQLSRELKFCTQCGCRVVTSRVKD